jgi:TPM domain
MKCPHCSTPLAQSQASCTQCGFSAAAIRAYLGADWVRLERLTDVAGRLNLRETRHLEVVLDEFERRFPQCFMAAYIGVLPDTLTLPDLGFWLINHGAFQTHQISRRNDFAIVMLVDPLREEAAFIVGYALEKALTEPVLAKILSKLRRKLKGGAIAAGIEDGCALIDHALRRSARQEPRLRESAPSVVGDASDLGLQSLRPSPRSITRPHATPRAH